MTPSPDEVSAGVERAWRQREQLLRRFEDAWLNGERPCIDNFLDGEAAPRHELLIELVHTELEYRLRAGEPATAAEYLRRYPGLSDPALVLELHQVEFEWRSKAEHRSQTAVSPSPSPGSEPCWSRRRVVSLVGVVLAAAAVSLFLALDLSRRQRNVSPGDQSAAEARPPRAVLRHDSAVCAIAFRPGAEEVLTGGWDPPACLWDAATGSKRREFAGHTQAVRAVAFSPDGRLAVTGGDDKKVRFWQTDSGELLHTFSVNRQLYALALSHDGKHIALGTDDSQVVVFGFAPGKPWSVALKAILGAHKGGVHALAFSPDDALLVTACADGFVRVWNWPQSKGQRAFQHTGAVLTVAFRPDGAAILSGSADGTAVIWDLEGKAMHRFTQAGPVLAVAFSPDGRQVLLGGVERTAQLWDLTGTAAPAARCPHPDDVCAVGFSPDGKTIMTASKDGTVQLWDR